VKAFVAVAALSSALLLAAAAPAADPSPPARDVTMPGKVFSPSRLGILAGTTVTWRNGDSTNHTVTADGNAFDSGFVVPGGSYSFAFERPGHYAYHCTIHRFMKGSVDVFALVLSGPEAPVAAGGAVWLTGLAPAGTTAVTLREEGGATLTLRPRPDGSFRTRVLATAPATYKAVLGGGASPSIRIEVVPRVRARRAGRAVVATVAPARPGARAVLQAYDREHFTWRDIARGRVDGASRVRLVLPTVAERVRVLVRGSAGWADAASPALLPSH
jgi:plastocyanin